jgi:hypothetical protein
MTIKKMIAIEMMIMEIRMRTVLFLILMMKIVMRIITGKIHV